MVFKRTKLSYASSAAFKDLRLNEWCVILIQSFPERDLYTAQIAIRSWVVRMVFLFYGLPEARIVRWTGRALLQKRIGKGVVVGKRLRLGQMLLR